MIYKLEFAPNALADIQELKKSNIAAYKKIQRLLIELQEHPTIGTGKPKPLRYKHDNEWSRRVTDKHRLVYIVINEKVTVLVISVAGHYGDK